MKSEEFATAMNNKAPTFDEFWKAYPLHKARKQAEQAWQRLTASDRRAAIAALPAYIEDCEQNGIAFKYAQGWLNGRRWEDELTSLPPVNTTLRQLQNPDLWKMSPAVAEAARKQILETDDAATPPDGMEKW